MRLEIITNFLNRRWLRKSLQSLILLVILFFVGLTLYRNWTQIASYDWQIDYVLISISLVLVVLTMLLGASIWALILNYFSNSSSMIELIAIWLESQLAKYIPGGVWNLVGRAYLSQKRGLSNTTNIFLSLFLEQALLLMAQFLVVLILGVFTIDFLQNNIYFALLGMPTILAGIIVTHPKILKMCVNLLARFRSKTILLPTIQHLRIIGFMCLYVIFVILSGFTFFVFISSIYHLPFSTLPSIISIVTISFVIGFLSPLTPNGLGLREGIFTILLSQLMPLPVAIIIALTSRVWLMVGELLSAGLGTVLLNAYPNTDAPKKAALKP